MGVSCVCCDVVWAEKVMGTETVIFGFSMRESVSIIAAVLPTPETPVKSTERPTSRQESRIDENRTVSIVGTMLANKFSVGNRVDIGDTFSVLFTAFLGFEVCVGAFQPCIASLRSKYVPDALQSTVNNLFRCPLNMLVAAGTMLSDFFPLHIVFAICTAAHAAATLCQLRLAMATPKAKVASD